MAVLAAGGVAAAYIIKRWVRTMDLLEERDKERAKREEENTEKHRKAILEIAVKSAEDRTELMGILQSLSEAIAAISEAVKNNNNPN